MPLFSDVVTPWFRWFIILIRASFAAYVRKILSVLSVEPSLIIINSMSLNVCVKIDSRELTRYVSPLYTGIIILTAAMSVLYYSGLLHAWSCIMIKDMKFLNQKNRSILREMTVTDFKLRYQGSILGYVWSLMRPMFMFLVLYLVFVVFFKVGHDVPHFAVYLLLGIVLWTFFLEITSNGLNVIVSRGDMLRKISIPRYLLVVSVSASALINLALNLVVVFIFALFDRVEFGPLLLLLPLIILELYIFSLSIAFILSALYVKFRDISHIWEILMQAAFYATPIVYPLLRVPENLRNMIMHNPLAQIIQDARYVFVTTATDTSWVILGIKNTLLTILIVVVIAIFAYFYFKKAQRNFAEEI